MPRQPSLVCQHLENVSRRTLEQYQHIIRRYVRNRHGVYALYRRGQLYDVGLAPNLPHRLGGHLKDRHSDSWDYFSLYLTTGDDQLQELQSLLLRIALPQASKKSRRFPQSEDLSSRLRLDAKRARYPSRPDAEPAR